MTGLVPNTASAHPLPTDAVVAAGHPAAGRLPARRDGHAVASNINLSHVGNNWERVQADGRWAGIRRPHSVDLGGLGRRPPEGAIAHSWLTVVPCKRIRPRECDELPDEFRRAGIGVCFEGSC